MAEVEFRQMVGFPRDLDRRPTPADFRPGATRRVPGTELEGADRPGKNEVHDDRTIEMDMEAILNPRKVQQPVTPKPLDEIAAVVQGLTYGEMIELSGAMWKCQEEGAAITQENPPALLHRWSVTRTLAALRAITGEQSD